MQNEEWLETEPKGEGGRQNAKTRQLPLRFDLVRRGFAAKLASWKRQS
jgi:hypothetical protein